MVSAMANRFAEENRYRPDFVSPPGDTLLETIETIGMPQVELAKRMGRPPKTINGIIKGTVAITPETALQLERVLGVSASFWNNRESNYRDFLAREKENSMKCIECRSPIHPERLLAFPRAKTCSRECSLSRKRKLMSAGAVRCNRRKRQKRRVTIGN